MTVCFTDIYEWREFIKLFMGEDVKNKIESREKAKKKGFWGKVGDFLNTCIGC